MTHHFDHNRRLICAGALALTGASFLGRAWAQAAAWNPGRPITLVNPFPPGGASDALLRHMAERFGSGFARPSIVENKPGAGSVVAFMQVARSAPDGTTLLMGTNTGLTISPHLSKKLPYDPFTSFTAVAPLVRMPSALMALPKFGPNNMPQLLTAARKEPGKLTYASFGVGSTSHLIMEQIKAVANVDLLHVPYKGGAMQLQALLGGEVDIAVDTLGAAMPRAKAGTIKILGVLQPKRTQLAPEIPSLEDAGIRGAGLTPWIGLFGPAGIPPNVLAALNQMIRSVQNEPETRKRFVDLGADAWEDEPAAFVAAMKTESQQMAEIVKRLKLSID